jgi:hypothetical protein
MNFAIRDKPIKDSLAFVFLLGFQKNAQPVIKNMLLIPTSQ